MLQNDLSGKTNLVFFCFFDTEDYIIISNFLSEAKNPGRIMRTKTFAFKDKEGAEIFVYYWLPEEKITPKAVVQISHGMAEHAFRYERFAQALTKAGYIVYANDHRGHGRTVGDVEKLGIIADKDGFSWMMGDMRQLSEIIQKEHPGLSLFLFGHSMGSFLVQGYISQYGENLKGVILSGTIGKVRILADIGLVLAGLEIFIRGSRDQKSPFLLSLGMGSYNNDFKPTRTRYDWISRDIAEVDKYKNDPYCGTIFPSGYFYDLAVWLRWIHSRKEMSKIAKNLPIYLIAGEMDPVGQKTKTVRSLIKAYQKLGIQDIAYRFYPGARHELLNETNRDEATKDIIVWLDAHRGIS
jgi:alpha-beta hydrolase superfamily lysophospholipase